MILIRLVISTSNYNTALEISKRILKNLDLLDAKSIKERLMHHWSIENTTIAEVEIEFNKQQNIQNINKFLKSISTQWTMHPPNEVTTSYIKSFNLRKYVAKVTVFTT